MSEKDKINIDDFLDSDADGLSDQEEKRLGTNPHSADTDHDGLPDLVESKIYGTDPLNSDTDGDGFNDGQEVQNGRNPKGPGKLKDLFIPHAGNGYRPKALEPRRLLFHALSLVAIKFVVIAAVIFFPMVAWLTPDVLGEQAAKIIALTNQIRENHGVGRLSQNSLLSQSAYRKAEDMLINQYFAHVSPGGKQLANWLSESKYAYKVAGENLAIGFAKAEDVIDAWVKSPTHYDNLIDADFSDIGVGVVSGPYNNHETVLVAQHFGEPKAPIAVKEPEPVKTPEPDAVTAKLPETKTIKPQPPEQVLSEIDRLPEKKETPEPLAKPELIYPANNYLTNEPLVKFKAFAPKAESVDFFLDGQLFDQVKTEDGYAETQKIFVSGRYKISLTAVRGVEKAASGEIFLNIDLEPPFIDETETYLTVVQPQGQADKLVRVVAFLSADTAKADVLFGNSYLSLSREEAEQNKWVGQAVFPNEQTGPLVLPLLIAEDRAGNVTKQDISWAKAEPLEPSLLSQYSFIKEHPSAAVKNLFDVSGWYYRIVLVLALAALLLNIFVEIKKQHPKIIASSAGFVALLIFLMVI